MTKESYNPLTESGKDGLYKKIIGETQQQTTKERAEIESNIQNFSATELLSLTSEQLRAAFFRKVTTGQAEAVQKDVADFQHWSQIAIDFKGNADAEAIVGAGNLLPSEVRCVEITDLDGHRRAGIRMSSPRVGYYDAAGYIGIHSGYQIRIVPPAEANQQNFIMRLALPATEIVSYYTHDDHPQRFAKALKEYKFTFESAEDRQAVTDEEQKSHHDFLEMIKDRESYAEKIGQLSGSLKQEPLNDQQRQIFDQIASQSGTLLAENGPFSTLTAQLPLPPPQRGTLPLAEIVTIVRAHQAEFIANLQAVAYQESRYNPEVVGRPTNYGQARGLFQFLPGTWSANLERYQGWGVRFAGDESDIFNPAGQIKMATLEYARLFAGYIKYGLNSATSLNACAAAWFTGENRQALQNYVRQAKYGHSETGDLSGLNDGGANVSTYMAETSKRRQFFLNGEVVSSENETPSANPFDRYIPRSPYIKVNQPIWLRREAIATFTELEKCLADWNKSGQKISLVVNSSYRNFARQSYLYKNRGKGFVARPGESPHHTGGAMDLNLELNGQIALGIKNGRDAVMNEAAYQRLQQLMSQAGWSQPYIEEGDLVHFEMNERLAHRDDPRWAKVDRRA